MITPGLKMFATAFSGRRKIEARGRFSTTCNLTVILAELLSQGRRQRTNSLPVF